MIRILVALSAGLALVGCSALDAETIAHGHQDANARNLQFNSSECSIVIDSRAVTIRSTNGSIVRTSDSFCEPTKQMVTTTGTRTVAMATISGDVAFDVNSATIKSSFFTTLDGLANQMRSRAGSRFTIIGHTDSTGPDDYNQQLSERRARSVADYLVSKGVDRNSLAILGVGEGRPTADNGTAEGRRSNRRVEVFEVTGGGSVSSTTTRTVTTSGGYSGQGVLVGPSGILR